MLGVALEQRTFLLKVLQQIFDADTFFGMASRWTRATLDGRSGLAESNPGLGITPRLDEMRAYAPKAQHSDDRAGEFKTKRLNLWLSSAIAWLPMEAWHRCADPTLSIDAFAGEPCYIGFDGAERDDLTAVVAVFEQAGLLYAFPKFFLPADVVEERSRAVPAYRGWMTAGVLTATDGSMTDLNGVEAYIRGLVATFTT